MKTVTIHAGHNPKGKIACGASDYLDESTEARLLVKALKKYLKSYGVKAYDCTVNNGCNQSDILHKIVNKCNSHNRDADISVHFNACSHSIADSRTKGTECHVYNVNSKITLLASEICNGISYCGFKNRGVKASPSLYVLKHTDKPCILIEVCFVDDQDDARLYKTNNRRNKIAKTIARAIADF